MELATDKLSYRAVDGYFKQSDPSTDAHSFDYTLENFGLVDRPYDTDITLDPQRHTTQWQRFEHHVQSLNQRSSGASYKVIFMGRHGEGFHNVAESFYGTPAWDAYWSLQPGNGTMNWTDAQLTPKGVEQARIAHRFWATELEREAIPSPETYYVSPLFRCLQTAHHTFHDLASPSDRPFVPLVKELMREVIGEHTCDMRSSRTWISERYPSWPIEEGFSEDDQLWTAEHRETKAETVSRMHRLLQDILRSDSHTFLSFTTHSGAIAALLQALQHRPFWLNTGAVIPVLVRIEKG